MEDLQIVNSMNSIIGQYHMVKQKDTGYTSNVGNTVCTGNNNDDIGDTGAPGHIYYIAN